MKKIGRVVLIIFMIQAVFLLASCSKKKPPKPEPTKYKWTILGYFDGNNSQDRAPDGHSYVIKDLQELEGIDSTDQVQIVVMLGSFKTDGNCKYYHVERYLNEPQDSISSEVLLDLGKKNMSDFTTLRDFLGYGMQKYPAKHYMLIINDHAGGWKGVCSDTINGGGSWMSLPDLSLALAGFTFDIIWFYTPSMATVEVAYQIKDRSKYMIASQFKWRPDNILGATQLGGDSAWLSYLTDNPNIDVMTFAYKITQAIYTAAQKIHPRKPVHSTLIYLPKISSVVNNISNLGRSLKHFTGTHWREVWDAWKASLNYLHLESSFADIWYFARYLQVIPDLDSLIIEDAKAVEGAVNTAVSALYKEPDYPMIGGISIHFPWNQRDFDSASYAYLDFSTANWDDFLSVFIQTFLGNYAGALDIRSIPTGADIFLNGVDTGYKTNAIIGGLLPGDYDLKITKEGYKDEYFTPTIYAQDTTTFFVVLKKL